jgi:hypothetical protein
VDDRGDNRSQPKDSRGVPAPGGDTAPAWSHLVSSATLEDELKAINSRLDAALQNQADLKTRGYRQVRPQLGTAAVLFAIIQQFDGHVRWQPDAALARDRFARAARNASADSPQVARELQQRQQDLHDLIRGGRLSGSAPETPWVWPEVADRKLIMQRLEIAVEQAVGPAVASANDIRQQREGLLRESELAAALAQVLLQEDMPDAGDEQYDEMAGQLQQAALQLRQSLRENDPAAARNAHGAMKQSCVACHQLYRE